MTYAEAERQAERRLIIAEVEEFWRTRSIPS